MKEHFDINDFNNLLSPFFGGGSFEFHIQNNYKLNINSSSLFIIFGISVRMIKKIYVMN